MAIAFSLNPPIQPVPTAGAWIYNNISQTGTTANSSTAVTALAVGTSFLMVGQPVSGQNILPNTTIAVIVSATAITLSQQTASSGAGTGTLTFGTAPNLQSAFSASSLFALPLSSLVDVPGSDVDIPEVQTINAGATFIPAPGEGYFTLATSTTTAATIDIQIGAVGTWVSFLVGSTAAATTYYVAIDGGNFRFNNRGSAAQTFTFYRWRQKPSL
jgi:hypothetical protein